MTRNKPKRSLVRRIPRWIGELLLLWIIWSVVGALTNPPSVAGENYNPTFDTSEDYVLRTDR